MLHDNLNRENRTEIVTNPLHLHLFAPLKQTLPLVLLRRLALERRANVQGNS
jgi:hypothetical protein